MADLFGDSGFSFGDVASSLGGNVADAAASASSGNWWDSIGGGLDALSSGFDFGGKSFLDTASDIATKIKPIGAIGKELFGGWQAWDQMQMQADYNKAVEDYYKQQGEFTKQQQEYLKQKQAWEQGFMDQFAGAQEGFGEANAAFQEQISAASGKANEVMGQYLNAAKPLLAQSQDLLVPGVAALARGETPEAWQPLLNEARLRGTAAMVQSMVSAGMSPQEAHAAAQPVAEQQAQTMLLQLATSMITQGGQLSQVGMTGLGGAGALTEVMGKLAAMGMDAESREFQIMASVLGSILGQPVQGTSLGPPPKPVGAVS